MAQTGKPVKGLDRVEVLDILRHRIVEGEYLPGSKLVENDLAQEFGISRQMARELLQDLESRGLVQKEPNKGATIRRIDLKTLFEIMEVREVLEGLAARLATENTTAADWQDLVDAFGECMEEKVREKDLDGYLALVNTFQSRLLEAAANQELSDMADRIYAKMRIVQRRLILLPGRLQVGLAEHREILRAIVSGDGQKAEALKRENLRSAIAMLKKYKKWVL